jgi:hypothetical protein
MPTGLLKTGQTSSYVDYDDGYYQKGVARTFVTGGTTGLLWQRCSAGQNNDATCSGTAQTYTWDQANSYCSNLTLAGKTWRLPTVNELADLVDYWPRGMALIDSLNFPRTIFSDYDNYRSYWSSSRLPRDTNYSYCINFYDGLIQYFYNTNNLYIRCITKP